MDLFTYNEGVRVVCKSLQKACLLFERSRIMSCVQAEAEKLQFHPQAFDKDAS